jgi:biopolymer transport protein ExbB
MIDSISHSISFLSKGGIVMIPIVFCSFLSLAVFIERLWSLKRSKIIPAGFFSDTTKLIEKNDIKAALNQCDKNDSSLSRILETGIRSHGMPRSAVKEVIEEAGRREVALLDKYTGILGTVANITPLLGLLGTVSGMIKAFNVISAEGVGDPGVLAGGISEALITTASGLTIAIPTFVAYKYLLSKADSLVMEMEDYSSRGVEILKGKEMPQETGSSKSVSSSREDMPEE